MDDKLDGFVEHGEHNEHDKHDGEDGFEEDPVKVAGERVR